MSHDIAELVNALAATDGIPAHKAGLGKYGARLARLARDEGWCAAHGQPCRHGSEAVQHHGAQLEVLIADMGEGAF